MCFLRNGSSYSFETCTTHNSAHLKTSGCTEFGPLNTKESDVLTQNVFSQIINSFETWSSYSFETCFNHWIIIQHLRTCTFTISMPENLRVHWVWPSKYKGKWCFNPKCVFSETDHHTALKLVPLKLAHCWKPQWCTEFGPLNTKESDVLTQNVFSQKWIIIQLWNLYHCNWHTWKPQGALSLAL